MRAVPRWPRNRLKSGYSTGVLVIANTGSFSRADDMMRQSGAFGSSECLDTRRDTLQRFADARSGFLACCFAEFLDDGLPVVIAKGVGKLGGLNRFRYPHQRLGPLQTEPARNSCDPLPGAGRRADIAVAVDKQAFDDPSGKRRRVTCIPCSEGFHSVAIGHYSASYPAMTHGGTKSALLICLKSDKAQPIEQIPAQLPSPERFTLFDGPHVLAELRQPLQVMIERRQEPCRPGGACQPR
jgi:hypothetical protein